MLHELVQKDHLYAHISILCDSELLALEKEVEHVITETKTGKLTPEAIKWRSSSMLLLLIGALCERELKKRKIEYPLKNYLSQIDALVGA